MNLEKLKDAARKYEQKEDWRRAIEVYQKAIQEFESGRDSNPDLSIYNRVGDLFMKANESASAVQAYERAVDLYGDQGFLNNAIALCGKVLRVNPGRIQTYLKLAYLHARKNVVIEAKRNLIEYLERMHSMSQLDDAFKALRSFADAFPHNKEIRQMLTELSRAGSRNPDTRERLEQLAEHLEHGSAPRPSRATNIHGEPIQEGRGRGNELVFLDIGTGTPVEGGKEPPDTGGDTPEADTETWEAEDLPPVETGEDSLVVIGGDETVPEEPATPDETLELEPTHHEPVDMELDIPPPDGLELETTSEADLNLDEPLPVEPELIILPDAADGLVPVDDVEGLDVFRGEYVEAGDELVSDAPVEEVLEVGADLEGVLEEQALEAELQEPVAPVDEDVVWDTDLLDEQAGVTDETPADSRIPEPTLDELEDRVLDDPENPDAHRALGEALIASGDAARGMDELDLALMNCENQEQWHRALDIVNELIRLDPASVRYYQKRVEIAYRTGDRGRLVDSYLELADALVRAGMIEKAVAVYHRIAEHDPENQRARAALDLMEPREATAEPGEAPREAPAVAPPATPAPRAPATTDLQGFIDLGSLVSEGEVPRDTRMRVEDEEPTGDEEKDFADLLQQFKRGIDENVAAEDYQSHYDLGVAFKEMGLLDEAIAEFQKALRAPEVRLRTSEALGVCFVEKDQHAIAEAILRRAVEDQPGSDDEKVGLLYWLGRALEAQQRPAEALACYQRVMAVDIRFADAGNRMHQVTAGQGS